MYGCGGERVPLLELLKPTLGSVEVLKHMPQHKPFVSVGPRDSMSPLPLQVHPLNEGVLQGLVVESWSCLAVQLTVCRRSEVARGWWL